MKRIVLASYHCDPHGVSEAYSASRWAEMLARRYPVQLCTAACYVPSLEAWARDELDDVVASNLSFLPVATPVLERHLKSVGAALKPGYFHFDRTLRTMLARPGTLDGAGLVWRYKPTSFRFRSSLYKLDVPFVIGPLGGGLQPPEQLVEYFRGEPGLFRLRAADGMLLRSRYWMRPLDEAAALLITSDYMRELLPEHLARRAVSLLATGVDMPASARIRASEPGRFRVLFVGRMTKYKGPELALRAFARFLEEAGRPAGTTLVMVGDGEELESAKRLADELGVSGIVEFTGRLPRTETLRVYDDADVFLFPSITEAAGNVYLEAMRSGLPMIVVAHGGGKDVPCEDAAIKVPLASAAKIVDGLARGLEKLYGDRAAMLRMGEAGVACVRERYSWEALSRRVYDLVECVMAGQRVSGGPA